MNNLSTNRLYDPLSKLDQVNDMFDYLFGFNFPTYQSENKKLLRPTSKISEDDNNYTVTVEIPGVNKDDVSISIDDNNILSISGEKKEEKSKSNESVHYSEISYGSFERKVPLSNKNINIGNIEAVWNNGVLKIIIPKNKEEKPPNKKIEIKSI